MSFDRICYHKDLNLFTDIGGYVIYNMLDYLTSNDILLFKHDPGYNLFCHKDHHVEIITYPDEACGEQEFGEIIF